MICTEGFATPTVDDGGTSAGFAVAADCSGGGAAGFAALGVAFGSGGAARRTTCGIGSGGRGTRR
jgi:hypothetical protein